jgi:hypothetical protein
MPSTVAADAAAQTDIRTVSAEKIIFKIFLFIWYSSLLNLQRVFPSLYAVFSAVLLFRPVASKSHPLPASGGSRVLDNN